VSEPPREMDELDFMLGSWTLDYKLPRSFMAAEGGTGKGIGVLQRALNGRYVFFDYSASGTFGQAKAHGIFAWDAKEKLYRYWWFEDSGANLVATGNFVDDDTLFLAWQDTEFQGKKMRCQQTFTKQNPDRFILRMECRVEGDDFEPVLEVTFTRSRNRS